MSQMNDKGWTEWGHHILSELGRLNTSYEKIRDDHADLKEALIEKTGELSDKINQIRLQHNNCKINEFEQWKGLYDKNSVLLSVKDLKDWKKDVSEIVSVTQLEKLNDDVQALKSFRLKATTIFIVVQTLMGILLSMFKFQIIPI